MPQISLKITDSQYAILQSLSRQFHGISAVVRDLIDQEGVRRGIALDSPATLGGPSAAQGLPSSSKKVSNLLKKEDIEGILAAYADDVLQVGWKDLVLEWWETRNATHRSKAVKSRRAFKTSIEALIAAKFLYGDKKANALLEKAVTKGWIGIEASWAENIKVEKTLEQAIQEKPAASLELDALETQIYNWYNSLPPGDQKASVERAIANPEENEAEFVVFKKMGLIK